MSLTSAHLKSGANSETRSGNNLETSWHKYWSIPRIEANRLRELPDCYKIKLRSAGYRLIYQVMDHAIVVFVVSVDKRENEAAYCKAQGRVK